MEITNTKMCAIGQRLRYQAVFANPYIQHGQWNALIDTTPLACANMTKEAHKLNDASAFAAWQEHYHSCPTCQEALRP